MRLSILENGSRETLKGVVHAFALGLAALIATYNTAAWLQRRQRHLAVNTIVYIALVLFEVRHVRHHFTDRSTSALLAAAVAAAAAEELPAEPKAA